MRLTRRHDAAASCSLAPVRGSLLLRRTGGGARSGNPAGGARGRRHRRCGKRRGAAASGADRQRARHPAAAAGRSRDRRHRICRLRYARHRHCRHDHRFRQHLRQRAGGRSRSGSPDHDRWCRSPARRLARGADGGAEHGSGSRLAIEHPCGRGPSRGGGTGSRHRQGWRAQRGGAAGPAFTVDAGHRAAAAGRLGHGERPAQRGRRDRGNTPGPFRARPGHRARNDAMGPWHPAYR